MRLLAAKSAETDYYNEFEAEAEFTISKAAQSFQIASQESKTYGDDLSKPSLSGIKESEDYSVEYAGNTEIGTATVTITGINGYAGYAATANFQITENGFTPILNSPLATSPSPPAAYYTLTGKPLGNAKPKAPGIYIEKKGHETRKVAVR